MDAADPVPGTPVATRAGVSRDTARNRNLTARPDALAATALRTKSLHAREVLVEAAWPGRSAEDVDRWAAAARAGRETDVPEGADAYALGQLARVLALQLPEPDDVARARTLLEALAAVGRLDELHPQAVQVLLHLRCQEGDAEGCRALLRHRHVPGDVAAAVRADLANPFSPVAAPGSDLDRWLPLLGGALVSDGLAPLRLRPESDGPGVTPFDRLTTDPLPPADVEGDRLVTVAMSTYRPGPALLTAVSSLLAQTWRALEVLVVDDASGPGAEPWLRRAEDLDPRVRVIRKAVNGGTYRARNTALRQARGAYFTTLDSDDWLHPEAIATLVRTLEADPRLVAVRALGARVTEELRLVRLGYRHRAVAAPTLLVRLDPALDRVGFFDPTRKSADTEYARRLQAAFGTRSVHTVDECLLLLRAGEDSLSAAEFSRGWRHPARHAYKALYTPWHEEIAAGAPAYLDPDGPRAFPEPRRWRKDLHPALPAPRRLDLVLGGDWRRYGGPQRSMLEEIRAAREAGMRVGVLHLEALRFASNKDLPLCGPVTEAIRRGEVEWVQVDDDVDVDVLMIRYPLVLQHPPHVPGGRALRPRHLLVVANQAPVEPDGSDQRYVVADVTERSRELFGVEPVWVPQGAVVREVLRAQDPTVRLTDWDNPGLVDLAEWHVRDDRAPGADGAPVVVGRYSRDDPLKFPPTHADLVAAYDLGPGYAVRLMGARTTWRRLAAEAGLDEDPPVPPGWEILPAGAVDPKEFLAGLDFFLYQDHPGRHEAFGRVLLEAAASGLVVVAHPKHEAVFGAVLDYALPQDAREVIAGYVADPDRYRARVAQVQRLVLERYSHASFVRRLASVQGGGAPAADAPVARGRVEVALRTPADAAHRDVVVLDVPDDAPEAAVDRVREALAEAPDGSALEALVAAAEQGGAVRLVEVRRQERPR
ncbi:glycosyltransferase involved in cell wall biosynthesis [Ornithinimicrobium humiphilum]|uniref:Glycosyltransferase involved in cell wall biosynthesis n=1 Tax=Ornithinimicrobium humiphilum TaxID=125288 RepID=A0A543KJC1_9MICO|nr:glycosyltransferase [Ornithinimicrobium humiphilum]TQM95181.1 glycosyltransferase involved in cell wall biosynthesis [Ornithinimicrobium humiphilum]